MKLSGAFWHLSQPYCDEAFAKQFTAPSYTTFVAMPFGNSNKYNADDIYRRLKEKGSSTRQ
jgi:hypothetical protein